jgi:hypothetical protein
MISFAIRDDDTSFFTDPEELEVVYGYYWGQIPISLAVIPFAVPFHKERSLRSGWQISKPMPLGENQQLVTYLREKIRRGHVEILLHGFTHEYRYINGRWVGEFKWKSYEQMRWETRYGKRYLEELLGCSIRVFVPPSNIISADGVRAIVEAGLDLSGIMGRWGDRPISVQYIRAYLKRWMYRLRYGFPYPWPLEFDGHRELVAYALTPQANENRLMAALEHAIRVGAPFVVATHYWEFSRAPMMHNVLARLIERAKTANVQFTTLSLCIRNKGGVQCASSL